MDTTSKQTISSNQTQSRGTTTIWMLVLMLTKCSENTRSRLRVELDSFIPNSPHLEEPHTQAEATLIVSKQPKEWQ